MQNMMFGCQINRYLDKRNRELNIVQHGQTHLMVTYLCMLWRSDVMCDLHSEPHINHWHNTVIHNITRVCSIVK